MPLGMYVSLSNLHVYIANSACSHDQTLMLFVYASYQGANQLVKQTSSILDSKTKSNIPDAKNVNHRARGALHLENK